MGKKPGPPPLPKVELVCERCQAPFLVKRNRAIKVRFCSKRCQVSAQMTARHAAGRSVAAGGFKKCSDCRQEKSVADFWKRPDNHDGYRGQCIACSKRVQAVWLEQNAERKREADRQYATENADSISLYNKARYAADKEGYAAKNKNWRERNADKVAADNRKKRVTNGDDLRARRRQHYQENKARYKAQAVARMDHIKRATPPWADMEKIAAFYVEAERLTLETGIPHHVDHIYPLRGKTICGLHVEGNLQILHAVANLRKSNRIEGEDAYPRERPTGKQDGREVGL